MYSNACASIFHRVLDQNASGIISVRREAESDMKNIVSTGLKNAISSLRVIFESMGREGTWIPEGLDGNLMPARGDWKAFQKK